MEGSFAREANLIIPVLEVLKGLAGRYSPKQREYRAIVSGAMALHAVAWHKSGNAKAAAAYKGTNRRLIRWRKKYGMPTDATAFDWFSVGRTPCNIAKELMVLLSIAEQLVFESPEYNAIAAAGFALCRVAASEGLYSYYRRQRVNTGKLLTARQRAHLLSMGIKADP